MLSEKNVEIALYEIQKLYDYCVKNFDVENPLFTPEFGLVIYNNLVLLGPPYQQIMQGLYDEKNDPQYVEYCEKMKKTIMKYIDRDDQGTPQFDENQQPKITEMAVEFEKESAAIEKEYKELNERMMNKEGKNFEFLKQKVKVTMCCIDVASIPNGVPPSIVGCLTKPEA